MALGPFYCLVNSAMNFGYLLRKSFVQNRNAQIRLGAEQVKVQKLLYQLA